MTEPRYHTKRNTARRTLGPAVGSLARQMGKPLMPWQQSAMNVLLEVDANGRFWYKRAVITVPRQAGKTTVTLILALHRLLSTPEGKIWYTAQTGQAARERFIKDLVPPATKMLGRAISVKRGAGDTRMTFPALNSQLRPHPPNDEYLHGEQSDLNLIDEPWSYSEVQADALVQAFLPTQNTRPNAQTVYLSTMGDADSTWWHRQVDEARAGADPRTCIFDWGLPESVDPSDVEAVISSHPAVGYTIDADVVRAAANAMKPAEFARAYANIRTATRTAVFAPDVITRAVSSTASMAAGAAVAFGAAVAWDRSRAVIVAAGMDAAGIPVLEVVDARPGTSWVAERLRQLHSSHEPVAVVVDARSPASTVVAAPALAEVEGSPSILTIPDSRMVAAGTADFIDRMNTGNLRIRQDEEMIKALDSLALRVVGELGQLIDRKNSSGPVAAVEAAILAMAGLCQAPPPAPAPVIVSL